MPVTPPHAFERSDDGTQVTLKTGLKIEGTGTTATTGTIIQVGSSSSAVALNTAGQYGDVRYHSSTATSGTTYGRYLKLTGNGAGAEFIGGRDKVTLTAAAGNAHGSHDSLEVKAAGYVTGLGTAIRGNIVFSADEAVTQGTYYGVMAEIYPAGNTSALPTASNACLCINAQAGTAMDAVVNAIAFNGTDGATSMIYSATDATPDWTGSIRILVNGAKRYLHFTSAAAS